MGIPYGPVSSEELLETPEHDIGILRDPRVLEEDENRYRNRNQISEQALIGLACAIGSRGVAWLVQTGIIRPIGRGRNPGGLRIPLRSGASAKNARPGRESCNGEYEKAGHSIR